MIILFIMPKEKQQIEEAQRAVIVKIFIIIQKQKRIFLDFLINGLLDKNSFLKNHK